MPPRTSFSTAQPCTIYQKCNLIILKMLPRRSLKLWMVLRLYGLENLQCYIRNHINLAKYFEGLVAADSRFEVDRPLYVCLYVFLFYTPDWTSFLGFPWIPIHRDKTFLTRSSYSILFICNTFNLTKLADFC